MPWTYLQDSGWLLDPTGIHVATGYSGHEEGLNNPALEQAPSIGPVPHGTWNIGEAKFPIDHLGPLALPLSAVEATQTFGRYGFFIHGDTAEDVQLCIKMASHGCIILDHPTREKLSQSFDRTLFVAPNIKAIQ